jgi:hypothetical protein
MLHLPKLHIVCGCDECGRLPPMFAAGSVFGPSQFVKHAGLETKSKVWRSHIKT